MNPNENKQDVQNWMQPIQQIGQQNFTQQRQGSNSWLDSVQAPIYESMHKNILLPPNTATGNSETTLLVSKFPY